MFTNDQTDNTTGRPVGSAKAAGSLDESSAPIKPPLAFPAAVEFIVIMDPLARHPANVGDRRDPSMERREHRFRNDRREHVNHDSVDDRCGPENRGGVDRVPPAVRQPFDSV